MNRRKTLLATFFLGALLGIACDADSDTGSPGSRSGQGGGFEPDPSCEYDCLVVSDEEQVCAQLCPDGCLDIIMERDWEDDSGENAISTQSGYCEEDTPEFSSLIVLTCSLMFEDSAAGPEEDCLSSYSEEACQIAFEICLNGHAEPTTPG